MNSRDWSMHNDKFVELTIGKPWANRACSFERIDCWGLVCLYFLHVKGINIHHTEKYDADEDFITCFTDEVCFWTLCGTSHSADIFVAYVGNAPAHVGIIINGMAYHSRAESSQVRFDKIRTIERLFTKVEYYNYAVN